MTNIKEIKERFAYGAEVEGEQYAHKALLLEDIQWLISEVEAEKNEKPLTKEKKELLKGLAGSASSPISLNDIRDEYKKEIFAEEIIKESRQIIKDAKDTEVYRKALRRILGNVKDAFHDIRPEADPMKNIVRIKRIAEEALEDK